MDGNLTAVITGGLTVLGIWIGVKYKNGMPKKPDRVELLFSRYDSQYKNILSELEIVKEENGKLRREQNTLKNQLDDALRQINIKDDEIKILQSQVKSEELKRKDLLKRFNNLKAKYDRRERADG